MESEGWEILEGSRSRGYRCSRGDEVLHFFALGKWQLLQSEIDALYSRSSAQSPAVSKLISSSLCCRSLLASTHPRSARS